MATSQWRPDDCAKSSIGLDSCLRNSVVPINDHHGELSLKSDMDALIEPKPAAHSVKSRKWPGAGRRAY